MQVEILPFNERDIGFALTQTAREGWDSTAELFQVCLAHDPHGCFVARGSGSCVGMVTTTRYRESAWIGNLIVVPGFRSLGIGRRLMTRAMEHLGDDSIQTIRLEADPPGVKLYRSLGFVDEFESLRFKLKRAENAAANQRAVLTPSGARRCGPAELPILASFDAEYFGDDRSRLLSLLFEHARATYWVSTPSRPEGYAMALPSAFGVRIGPWIAHDTDTAACLLEAILSDFDGRTLGLGIASKNSEGVALLDSRGFTRTPSSLRMIYGPQAGACNPKTIYGIANGAMG